MNDVRAIAAAKVIAILTEDDVRDYELGQCFFCGSGYAPVPGPRGGVKGEREREPTHLADCPYVELRTAFEVSG